MDLEIKDQRFIVCGASSGFGRAIAKVLLENGAQIIAVARREGKLA
jgi:3-oxoacyl-[acyl-carrier protein] reductase